LGRVFGTNKYWVEYDRFNKTILKRLLKAEFGNVKKCLKMAIQFFIHFPANGCITTYSFHLLACHWGPYEKIIENLRNYALSSGFLGQMNNYAAEEALYKQKKRVYLIRFSRLCPDMLTITYKNEKGVVTNTRKPKEQSMEEFLKKNISQKPSIHYRPISIKFKWHLAKEKSSSVLTYASHNGWYTTASLT